MSEERKYHGHTLDELDALHAAATPGPYTVYGMRPLTVFGVIQGSGVPVADQLLTHEDAQHVAAACNALPHLTARVRELEDKLDAVSQRWKAANSLRELDKERIEQLEADLATASRGYTERTKQLQAQLSAAMEMLADDARLAPPAPIRVSVSSCDCGKCMACSLVAKIRESGDASRGAK